MRTSLVSRLFLAAAAYCLVFFALVSFQFGHKNVFTHKAGAMVVQGRFAPASGTVKTALDGGVSVFFGGMEFDFGRIDKKSFTLVSHAFGVKPAVPRSLQLTDNGLVLRLEEGPDISVFTQYSGGVLELVIEAAFPGARPDAEPPYTGLQIPYKPLYTSSIQENASSFMLTADGINYAFTRNAGPARTLYLEPENHRIGYRVIPERKLVDPGDFILAEAQAPSAYEAALSLWRDKAYSVWNKAAGSPESLRVFSGDGEAASAYMSEALRRGTYRAAAQALSAVYVPTADSWESSVYGGKLDTAFRYLSASERERYTRLARYFNEKSADFLGDFHVIGYLGTRGYGNLLDDAADILRNFDPAVMTLEQSAGFLEGRFDWETLRPETDNPFVRFTDQAFFVLNDGLGKNTSASQVLVFQGDEADIELNLRLGASLLRFDDTRRELGQSLVLSVLSLADDAGSAPRTVIRNGNGNFSEASGGQRLSSARIYRILGNGEYYAGASAINLPARSGGLWAWTASQSLRAEETRTMLDIEVAFPAGETHYMMIRGVRPFARLQFSGSDQPSDPQFERYDASGWLYLPQEQALLVKLRHRSVTEHIRLLQTPAAPPPVPRETVEAADIGN